MKKTYKKLEQDYLNGNTTPKRKIKVLIIATVDIRRQEKIHNADIVLIRKKDGYEVLKNKYSRDFKIKTRKEIEKIKQNSKYIVEEFDERTK